MAFNDDCSALRTDLKDLAARIRKFQQQPITLKVDVAGDIGEARANLQLAYRHIEDATMRLGKAIQAWDGGTSIYDK